MKRLLRLMQMTGLVAAIGVGIGIGHAVSAESSAPTRQDGGRSREKWGTFITCEKQGAECSTSHALFACTYDRAVQIAERGPTPPYGKDCEILSSNTEFEIEATRHPKVAYAKSGKSHIGYVPINASLDGVRSGRFPPELQGVWLSSEANCRKFLRAGRSGYDIDDFLKITASEYQGHEETARVLSIQEFGRGSWQVEMHFGGEGTEWFTSQTFQRVGDTLRFPAGARESARILCSPGRARKPMLQQDRHADFPARPYRGPIAMPDFHGRDRAHRAYRTRISEGARRGPNAAGHLAIIPIGCGTRCLFFPVVDVLTGRVSSFPIGGEEYPSIDLDYRINSNLVIATWEENPERCMRAAYLWTGRVFRQASGLEVISNDGCPP